MREKIELIGIIIVTSFLICACASLGSKTIYYDNCTKIQKSTKLLIAEPTLIKATQTTKEVQNTINTIISQELTSQNVETQVLDNYSLNFEEVKQGVQLNVPSDLNADFILFSKLERLTVKNLTRDYKVEYKLVSIKEKKLIFHSKYNTTFGATVVIIPGIKDYPNTDQMMVIGIKSGLHELKNKLLK